MNGLELGGLLAAAILVVLIAATLTDVWERRIKPWRKRGRR
ncbi:hypothetical protein QMK19_03270 [Streptomyces sp. H10-C2]|nr:MULTISPECIES: hypothetical protein [unclassified Streptomyces]MDJ0342206.1 hypothetical protein [Streptomyces sp. PH10-H1]MDJ0368720.1 hypothetical protein [Streptomyces sp. H10-C2]